MASTSFWARLVWGSRELRLDEEPYQLGQSFSPPAVGRTVTYSHGVRDNDQYADRNWGFEIRVQGGNEEEVRGYITNLISFLELARDKTYKLYFEYYPHAAIGAIPLWGQGVYRYQIKEGVASISSPWVVRDVMQIVQVNCTIAPYAEGLRQRLAQSKGMTIDDNGITGASRGVIVSNSVSNLCLNPIFSHSTWNNTWTASGSATMAKNTDPQYIMFGDVSAKLANTSSSAGTISVTTNMGTVSGAGTYLLSCYVKKPGGGTFGTADVQFVAGTAVAGTALGDFGTITIGNDWYRIHDTVNLGTALTYRVGLNIYNPGKAFYMDGFQVEYLKDGNDKEKPTPLVQGDAIGGSWADARGSSVATAVPGIMKLAYNVDTFNPSQGCVRMALKWNTNATTSGTHYLYYAGTANSMSNRAYFNPGDDKIYFYAGGTYVASAAQSFTPNDIYIYHFVWGDTGPNDTSRKVVMYINGVESAYNGNFSTIDAAGFINIGCDNNGTAQLQANILDFTIYDQYIGSANVYADYQQVYQWVTGGDGLGRQLNTIPYLSTIDGDNVVDAYYDATHQDWATAAGIPGNLPARTVFDVSLTLDASGDSGLLMANHAYSEFIPKQYEWSGVDSAGSVGTAWVSFPGTFLGLTRYLPAYSGRKMYISAVFTDSGTADAQGRAAISQYLTTNVFTSDWTTLNTTSTHKEWYLLGPMIIPDTMPNEYDWMQNYHNILFGFQLRRTAGDATNGTITMDFYRTVVGDGIVYLSLENMGTATTQSVIIDGMDAYAYFGDYEQGFRTIYGDPIEFEPGIYNHLTVLPLKISRNYDSSQATTFNRVYITPRYALL